jgi:hypothetical protein
MIDAIYFIFFWVLILQVVLFLFLNLPFPHSLKKGLVSCLTSSTVMMMIMRIHLGSCFLAAFFFVDLYQTENHFTEEKNRLKIEGHGHTGSGNAVSLT